MSVIGGAATYIKVSNMAGVTMRFRAQSHRWEGSDATGKFSFGQSATVRPFDGLHGREIWPRALIDGLPSKTCDPRDDIPHIVFDRYCGATARYTLRGSYFDPYFEYNGFDSALPTPPAPSAPQNLDLLIAKYLRISTISAKEPARWLLSCSETGKVDLWAVDDNSGRQKWVLEEVSELAGNYYRIRVARGTNAGKTYLSCTDQYAVELSDRDDGSGRQRWRFVTSSRGLTIQPYRPALPLGANPDAYPNYLSCSSDGTVVDLFGDEDGSGRQIWKVEAL